MAYLLNQSDLTSTTSNNGKENIIFFPKQKGFHRITKEKINEQISLFTNEIYINDDIKISYPETSYAIEDSIYIALMTQGEMRVNANNNNIIYEPSKTTIHQASYIPASSVEIKKDQGPLKGLGFIVHASVFDELELNFKKNTHNLKESFSNPKSRILANKILNLQQSSNLNKVYLHSKALEIVFLELLKLQEEPSQTNIKFSNFDLNALKKAKEILENSKIFPGISKLAKMVSLNEFKLKFGFKKYFGVTPYQLSLNKRLEFSLKLLKKDELNISEISRIMGFKQPQNFSTAFKKHYGVSPSKAKYRNFFSKKS